MMQRIIYNHHLNYMDIYGTIEMLELMKFTDSFLKGGVHYENYTVFSF